MKKFILVISSIFLFVSLLVGCKKNEYTTIYTPPTTTTKENITTNPTQTTTKENITTTTNPTPTTVTTTDGGGQVTTTLEEVNNKIQLMSLITELTFTNVQLKKSSSSTKTYVMNKEAKCNNFYNNLSNVTLEETDDLETAKVLYTLTINGSIKIEKVESDQYVIKFDSKYYIAFDMDFVDSLTDSDFDLIKNESGQLPWV